MTPQPLKMTTCMAESADFICRAVAGYLAEKLNSPIEFINGIPWQRRERLFDDGQIQVCWICGHRSLRMVVAGEIDAAAVDSTVLEFLIRRSPELGRQIRVIHTLGPSPMPPWVCHGSVQLEVRHRLRTALLEMHKNESGKAILAQGQLSCFLPVGDKDYDPIRDMARIAQETTL